MSEKVGDMYCTVQNIIFFKVYESWKVFADPICSLRARKDEEYVSKVAKTADEAGSLIDAGFDYVCTTPDELMIFKKKK